MAEDDNNLNLTENVDKVDDIISQLKNVPTLYKEIDQNNTTIDKDKVQEFVIEYSTKLIKDATESIEYIKDIVRAAPTADDVSALAELIGSTSTAIEILNKMDINQKKLQNSIKIKEMDIKNKKEQLETKVAATTYLLTREEVVKNLINDSEKIRKNKIIEI